MGWMFGVRFLVGVENFSLQHCAQTGSGAHPPSNAIDTGALSLGVKQPVHEADTHFHLVLRSKDMWSYTSTLPICLHGVVVS
jgi:hypothetical protein